MCACNMWENNLALNSSNDNLTTLSLNSCGCNSNTNNSCNMCNDTNATCQCSSCNSRNNSSNVRNLNETLRNNIGRRCCCEFLVGNNLVKRNGTICQVGSNYVALASNNVNCNGCMFCSTDNLTFIRVE